MTAAFRDAPHASGDESAIIAKLRAAGALTLSLVAEAGDALVGHVAFSPVTIDGRDTGWFGLGPLSVDAAFRRQAIAARLVREGLAGLRARQAGGCVVLGDPAYYARFGFAPNPALILPGVPPAFFQSLHFGDRIARGIVTYHPAFVA